MCRCRETLLNWVSTYTLFKPLLMQLLTGMSTSRYLPARGTAGLERSFVSGKRREPAPPPMMMANVLSVTATLLNWDMRKSRRRFWAGRSLNPTRKPASRAINFPDITALMLCGQARAETEPLWDLRLYSTPFHLDSESRNYVWNRWIYRRFQCINSTP